MIRAKISSTLKWLFLTELTIEAHETPTKLKFGNDDAISITAYAIIV